MLSYDLIICLPMVYFGKYVSSSSSVDLRFLTKTTLNSSNFLLKHSSKQKPLPTNVVYDPRTKENCQIFQCLDELLQPRHVTSLLETITITIMRISSHFTRYHSPGPCQYELFSFITPVGRTISMCLFAASPCVCVELTKTLPLTES